MTREEFKILIESELIRSSIVWEDLEDGGLKFKFKLLKGAMDGGQNGTMRRAGVAASFPAEGITYACEANVRQNAELVNQAILRCITNVWIVDSGD